jgi:transcriptional regulator with XRE-family HTH domain
MPATPSKERAEREIRRLAAQGFSQYEIGRRTGISRGQVFNILRGRTGVGQKSVRAVLENVRRDQSMLVLREYGSVWTQPANAANRSLLGSYWNAVKVAREKGDWGPLQKLRNRSVVVVEKGKRVKLELVTDPATLRDLENKHQLEPIEVTSYGLRRSRTSARMGARR